VRKIVAAAYSTAKQNTGYGFQGDPLRPISAKYYGYLIRAGQSDAQRRDPVVATARRRLQSERQPV